MRTGTFFGKQVILNNRDWKKCLKRVDIKKVNKKTEHGSNEYMIKKPCPFCTTKDRDCRKCPLDVFAPKNRISFGCIRLFKLVSKDIKVKHCLTLFDDYISWPYDDDEDARRILETIYIQLLKMKKN